MIEDLKRIISVVNEGSITKASRKLFITQPALTHAVKRVERELGINIFRKNGKRLVLTENGKESLVVIERIVKLWEGLAEKPSLTGRKRITIGVYDNASIILSPLFKKYFEDKNFQLEVIIDNSQKLFLQANMGILDICICVLDPAKSLPDNCVELFSFSEELISVSSKKWNTSLNKIPFILYNRDSISRKYIDGEFVKKGIVPSIIAESTSPGFIKEQALVGSAVALLPESFVRSELKSNLLEKIKLPIHFERKIVMYKNKETNTPIDKLIEEIKDYLVIKQGRRESDSQ